MKLPAVLAALMLGFVAAGSLPSVSPRALSDSSPVEEVPVQDDFELSPPPEPVEHGFSDGLLPPPAGESPRLSRESSPGWSVESSPALAPDVLKKIDDCYDIHADDRVFHGIVPDTGAPVHSFMGLAQFKALQRSNPDITLDRNKAGAKVYFATGSRGCTAIGTTRVKTPLGKMKFHVIDSSSPAVLSYKDMKALGLEVRHRPARLVKVNWWNNVLKEEPLTHQWQYPWYRPSEGLKCARKRCSWLSSICPCLGHPGEGPSGHSHAKTSTPGSPVDSTPQESPVHPTSPEIRSSGPSSPESCFREYSEDDHFFHGIVLDTGSSAWSTMGLPQLKALQRIKSGIELDRTKAGAINISFGPTEPCSSIGLARVPTRFGMMKFHVLDHGSPTLLSYPDMRKLGLEVRNRPWSRLVKVDRSGKIIDEEPLEEVPDRPGHPSYRYPWDCDDVQVSSSHATPSPPGSPVRSGLNSQHEPKLQRRGQGLPHSYLRDGSSTRAVGNRDRRARPGECGRTPKRN